MTGTAPPGPPGWADLATRMRACTACPELVTGRTQVVVGQPGAGGGLVLVGEAPGATEDVRGVPFVGAAGVLLNELLAAAGVVRAEVGVLNTLGCRPPGNRRPRPAELTACGGWLDRQLAALAPRLVVALGLTAARVMLGRPTALAAARGTEHRGRGGLPTVVSYHPSAAIRFGPRGAPRAALASDLVWAASLLAAA